MANDVNKVSVESAEKSSILELAVKSHQVLVPQNVYIGDTAELRVSFVSENAEKLLKGQSFVELPLSGFTGDLQLQDYQIEKLTLFSNGQNNYTFIITFIPWKTGNIDFPNYLLLEEENVVLKFENVTISSLIKDESVGLQGQNAPLLLPGTVYKIYGILVGVILVLLILIRLIVKRDSVAASIKKRKLIKKYKKNKKETLKNLGKILKKNEISDVDFAAEIQRLIRNYLEVRFEVPFTKTVSSEIKEKFYLGFITNPKNGRVKGLNEVSLDRTYYVESPISEQKKEAINSIEKIFLDTDIIRYAQNSQGLNKTKFLENEKQEMVEVIKQNIEILDVLEPSVQEEKKMQGVQND